MEPGKCPKCEAPVAEVNVADVSIQATQRSVKGMAFCCGNCHTILGITIDPTLMRNQIAAAVKQLIG